MKMRARARSTRLCQPVARNVVNMMKEGEGGVAFIIHVRDMKMLFNFVFYNHVCKEKAMHFDKFSF